MRRKASVRFGCLRSARCQWWRSPTLHCHRWQSTRKCRLRSLRRTTLVFVRSPGAWHLRWLYRERRRETPSTRGALSSFTRTTVVRICGRPLDVNTSPVWSRHAGARRAIADLRYPITSLTFTARPSFTDFTAASASASAVRPSSPLGDAFALPPIASMKAAISVA